MADVSSATKFFPTAKEGFTTTTSGSISPGATSVGLSSVAGLTNGDTVVLIIDPTDSTKKQAFTGVVDTGGSQITNVVWTEGTDTTHSTGATVVDYQAATHFSLISKGLLVSHEQTGVLKSGVVGTDNIVASAVTAAKIGTDAVTTAKILDSNVTTAKIATAAITSGKLAPTKGAGYYSLSNGSGGWNDISGCSVTITVPSDGTIALLWYNGGVKISSPPAISTDMRVYNSTSSTTMAATRSDVWNTNGVGQHGFVGQITLSAGSNTLKLQQSVSTGSGEVMHANLMVLLLNS